MYPKTDQLTKRCVQVDIFLKYVGETWWRALLYGLCIKTKMDLTYKMKIGSTVTKKQYASPGGQPRNGEGMHGEKQPGLGVPACGSYKWEVTTKKGRGGGRGNYRKTNRSLKGIQTWASDYRYSKRFKSSTGQNCRKQIWERSFISREPNSSLRDAYVSSLQRTPRVSYLNNSLRAIAFFKG